jgi:hypothetical protein
LAAVLKGVLKKEAGRAAIVTILHDDEDTCSAFVAALLADESVRKAIAAALLSETSLGASRSSRSFTAMKTPAVLLSPHC